jgi:hypothetical protein
MTPTRPLPAFGDAMRTAAARVRRSYLQFLPAILVTWLLVEVVAGASGRPMVVIAPSLFCLGLVGYAAAAARAAGRSEENVVWLTVTRASACVSYLGILLVLGLVSLIVLGVAAALGAGHDPLVLEIAVGVWAALVLLVCSRLWPGLVVPFLYGGRVRYSGSARSMLWVGPGLPTAWRMTATPGVLARVSAPYLLVAAFTAGAWGGARAFLALPGPVRFALDAAFYAAVVPFLVTLADVLGDGLRVPTAWDAAGR